MLDQARTLAYTCLDRWSDLVDCGNAEAEALASLLKMACKLLLPLAGHSTSSPVCPMLMCKGGNPLNIDVQRSDFPALAHLRERANAWVVTESTTSEPKDTCFQHLLEEIGACSKCL